MPRATLYAVTSSGGSSSPQVWVLPATPITAANPTGFGTPVLLDLDVQRERGGLPRRDGRGTAGYAGNAGGLYARWHPRGRLAGAGARQRFLRRRRRLRWRQPLTQQEPALVYHYLATDIMRFSPPHLAASAADDSLRELTFPIPIGSGADRHRYLAERRQLADLHECRQHPSISPAMRGGELRAVHLDEHLVHDVRFRFLRLSPLPVQ